LFLKKEEKKEKKPHEHTDESLSAITEREKLEMIPFIEDIVMVVTLENFIGQGRVREALIALCSFPLAMEKRVRQRDENIGGAMRGLFPNVALRGLPMATMKLIVYGTTCPPRTLCSSLGVC